MRPDYIIADEWYGQSNCLAGQYRKLRNRIYDMTDGASIARYIARHPFAFPGGHELFAVTDDGGVLCYECCKSEYYLIKTSYRGDGWHIAGYGTSAELDEPERCCNCDKTIG